MARVFAGGREIDIPTDNGGYVRVHDLKNMLGIPTGRALIRQEPTGENFYLSKNGKVRIAENVNFMDAPIAKRG